MPHLLRRLFFCAVMSAAGFYFVGGAQANDATQAGLAAACGLLAFFVLVYDFHAGDLAKEIAKRADEHARAERLIADVQVAISAYQMGARK